MAKRSLNGVTPVLAQSQSTEPAREHGTVQEPAVHYVALPRVLQRDMHAWTHAASERLCARGCATNIPSLANASLLLPADAPLTPASLPINHHHRLAPPAPPFQYSTFIRNSRHPRNHRTNSTTRAPSRHSANPLIVAPPPSTANVNAARIRHRQPVPLDRSQPFKPPCHPTLPYTPSPGSPWRWAQGIIRPPFSPLPPPPPPPANARRLSNLPIVRRHSVRPLAQPHHPPTKLQPVLLSTSPPLVSSRRGSARLGSA